MPDPLTIAWAVAQALPVALAGCALAALLRLARLPGGWSAAGLTGGLLAGALLGATGLGRVAPQAHERLFTGGQRERLALAALAPQQEADRAALARTGVSPAALNELERQQRDRRNTLQAQRKRDMRRRMEGRAGAIALALAGLLLVNSRRARTPLQIAPPPMSALAAGASFALFPAVVLGVVLWRGFGVAPALAFALGAAVGAGWPAAARRDADTDADAERVSIAGVAACATALILVLALAPAAAGFFAALAWLAIWLSAPTISGKPSWLAPALACISTALIAGLAAIAIDFALVAREGRFWIVLLVALLLAADGRTLGAWMGWRLAGEATERDRAWRRAAAMLAGSVGAAQIALAAWGTLHSNAVDFALAAVLLSASWVEISAPIARRFAPALDEGRLP